MENTLRKFYNEIMSKSKVGEYDDLLTAIGKEIDKLAPPVLTKLTPAKKAVVKKLTTQCKIK